MSQLPSTWRDHTTQTRPASSTLTWGAQFGPTQGWTLDLNGVWTQSEGSFEQVNIPEHPEETDTANGQFELGVYDYTDVNSFSELKYTQLEFHGRGTRAITRDTSFYVGGGIIDLDDESPYVYGDMTGSVVYTNAGIETAF